MAAVTAVALAVGAQAAQDDTTLVSRADGAAGAKSNGISSFPSISANGRYVAFSSEATNLDPDDTDATEDVFVRDLVTNETTLVSRADGATGAKGNAFSGVPSISGDGRQVAFMSTSTNLGDDGDSITDVFVRELLTNETTLVSRDTGVSGVKGNANSGSPAISENGRYVAFDSEATNLGGQTDVAADVLVRDQQTNTTTLVSRANGAAGTDANLDALAPSISATGRDVAFRSAATNLDPADADAIFNVFIRDTSSDSTALVDRADGASGAKANAGAGNPAISATGRYLAFNSSGSNLDPADPDPTPDVFIRDMQANDTTLASRANGPAGAKGNGASLTFGGAISSDGRYVAFHSAATNLSPADTDPTSDAYVRDVKSDATILADRADGPGGATANSAADTVRIAADALDVAFRSTATNLDPADSDSTQDIFVRGFAPGTGGGGTGPAARTISLEASKKKVKKGKKVKLSGAIDAGAITACAGGQPVDLQRAKKPSEPFKQLTSVTSDAGGEFLAKVKVKKTFSYRAVLGQTDACAADESDPKKVKAKTKKKK